jgi:hypothetical protein
LNTLPRPKIITIICVLGFIASVLSFPSIFSPFIKKKGAIVPAISGLLIALEFISIVGVWFMKRWGVTLYLATALAQQTLWLSIDTWKAYQIALPVIFLSIASFHYRKMDVNL